MMEFAAQVKIVTAAAGIVIASAAPTASQAPLEAVQFLPHRAVYDMTLARTTPGSGVAELAGRMVYELEGSACDGYTQNMRFVTRMTNRDGGVQLNDLRTSSWEEAAGKRLRFNSSQYRDDKLAEATQGDAARTDRSAPANVDLTIPNKRALALPPDVYFPIQHSLALVDAARAGKKLFSADIYDGSEKGDKIYTTSAFIGKPAAAGSLGIAKSIDRDGKLAGSPSWPVAIGYFEPKGEKKDAIPAYELAYRFFENGVSTDLFIDYGEFAVRGALSELTFLEQAKCSNGAAPVSRR